jgi:factor associated with neutral sphingomyelinase activation
MDLTHYPVFPWVLSDYTGVTLDLTSDKTFRDLSKPIGAINVKRLHDYKSRYLELPPEERYLYGTHYSCPGYVIGFLVREHPRHMLKFQGGKFENPNRLFSSI